MNDTFIIEAINHFLSKVEECSFELDRIGINNDTEAYVLSARRQAFIESAKYLMEQLK